MSARTSRLLVVTPDPRLTVRGCSEEVRDSSERERERERFIEEVGDSLGSVLGMSAVFFV